MHKRILKSVFNTLKVILINLFNRKYFRWIISLVFSLISSLRYFSIHLVYYKDNKWLHNLSGLWYVDFNPHFFFNYSKFYRIIKLHDFYIYHPKKGDIIIDIGAGVGMEVIVFSKLVGEIGKVYAIEAHPATFSCLDEMCKLNKFENVDLSCIAISNNTDTLYIEDKSNHQSNQVLKSNSAGIPVKALPLDTFIEEKNISRINYLRMNIEGSEFLAIESMDKCLDIAENVGISCHDFLFENNNQIRNKVSRILAEKGFVVYYNSSGHIVRDSWVYGKKIKN